MKKEIFRIAFSFLFLFIFFTKMVISVAPLVASHLDSNFMNSVIMQVEIEHQSTKGSEGAKDNLSKGEWLSGITKFNFTTPQICLSFRGYSSHDSLKVTAFHPSVPTPPPNC